MLCSVSSLKSLVTGRQLIKVGPLLVLLLAEGSPKVSPSQGSFTEPCSPKLVVGGGE